MSFQICLLQVQQQREEICARLKCSATHVNTVLKWLQEGLLMSSGLNCSGGKLSVDSVYHHAWKGSENVTSIIDTGVQCNCGLISTENVKESNGSWAVVSLNQTGPIFCNNDDLPCTPPWKPSQSGFSKVVVDVCSTKKSAIAIALDSCIAISNIGAIVTKC